MNGYSLEVWKRNKDWGLYVRVYNDPTGPSYFLIKKISFELAEVLVYNKLAGDLYGQVKDRLSFYAVKDKLTYETLNKWERIKIHIYVWLYEQLERLV